MYIKDPGHSAKSAVGRLCLINAYTLDPTKSEWADYALGKVWELSENKLTRNSSGSTQPQSNQLTESLWTDSCLKWN